MKYLNFVAGITLLLITSVVVGVLLEWPDTYITLTVCDVGQGDAILITSFYTQILVDGGKNAAVLECLAEHMPFWDKKIELIVATHPDADHIGGLIEVLKRYQAHQIWENGLTLGKETSIAADFMALASFQAELGAEVQAVTSGATVYADNGKIIGTVLAPSSNHQSIVVPNKDQTEISLLDKSSVESASSTNTNERSIVLYFNLDGVKMLLMGDLEAEGELALLHSSLISDVHVLKAGHHGAKTSTTSEFLHKSKPEIALISSGKNNSYGHPDPEVVSRLRASGAEIFRTDQHGSITFLIRDQVLGVQYLDKYREFAL